MFPTPTLSTDPFPHRSAPLEEACAGRPRDMAATLLFALSRRNEADGRPALIAAPRSWFGEYGKPYGPGLCGTAFLMTPTSTPAEALWVLEQALRSGAVALALGAIDGATLAQSRRLEFAARHGQSTGVLLPRRLDGLSAAQRRWRIAATPSAGDAFDPKAPGLPRLDAELVRGRGERPGVWRLEQIDETHRLRLVDGLADRGAAEGAEGGATAGLAA